MSDSDDEPPPPPTLTRGVPHTPTYELDEPPSPPRLVRSEGVGFNGMRRRPSPRVEGDDWIRQFTANTPITPITPRELRLTPTSSGSWTDSEEEDPLSWWFDIPYGYKKDGFWNHMFKQSDFFLVDEPIDKEKREAIDTLMSLLPIDYKPFYDTATRSQPLKSPFPKVVNVAFVKQFLTNVSRVQLTPEDRYKFEMMIMNFFMFAPMSALEGYLERLSRRGGKRKTKNKKVKYGTRKCSRV
jgi:hypothetical protein